MRRIEGPVNYAQHAFDLGRIGVAASPGGLVSIVIRTGPEEVEREILETWPGAVRGETGLTEAARDQIGEYFAGVRREFDLPLAFGNLSSFGMAVLERLKEVPFGETISYGELAALAGHPGAARAVGRVMAINPFPLVIPCHRVLGAGGKMTGYSGGEGIATKEWLLSFERRCLKTQKPE